MIVGDTVTREDILPEARAVERGIEPGNGLLSEAALLLLAQPLEPKLVARRKGGKGQWVPYLELFGIHQGA
jgi:hypothetical protein